MRRLLAPGAVLALLVAATGPTLASSGAPQLDPGQGFAVAGTDMVCAHGGPANEWGAACLHSKAKAGTPTYSFRLTEAKLGVYRRVSGPAVNIRSFREPIQAGFRQPHSPALSNFKLVGTLKVGQRILLTGSDIVCTVSSVSGKTAVACGKYGSTDGQTLVGSYSVAMSSSLLQAARYDAAHAPKSVLLVHEGR